MGIPNATELTGRCVIFIRKHQNASRALTRGPPGNFSMHSQPSPEQVPIPSPQLLPSDAELVQVPASRRSKVAAATRVTEAAAMIILARTAKRIVKPIAGNR